MRSIALLGFLILSFMKNNAYADECGKVWITTFDAELYSPENESSIEKKAFDIKYIRPAYLLEISKGMVNNSKGYDPNNTRVLIKFNDKKLFIDRKGVMRQGAEFKKIDSSAFESNLTDLCNAHQ